jgi:hypothetical protein
MTDTVGSDGPTPETVKRRFAESAETLEAIRERLKALVLAEESADRSAEALEESASSVSNLATATEELVTELASSQTLLQQALEQARDLVQSTDLMEIRRSVEALTQRVDRELTAAREGERAAQAEAARLANALTSRQKNRLGLK